MGSIILLILLLMFLVWAWPWIQENQLDKTTMGIVVCTEVRTYTGSYGKRYTRKVVTYEFEDESGKKWRGSLTGDRTLNIPDGSPIRVRYQGQQPSRNKGVLPDRLTHN